MSLTLWMPERNSQVSGHRKSGAGPRFKMRHHTGEMWDVNQLTENLYGQGMNKIIANKSHWFLKEMITDKMGPKIYGVQCQV